MWLQLNDRMSNFHKFLFTVKYTHYKYTYLCNECNYRLRLFFQKCCLTYCIIKFERQLRYVKNLTNDKHKFIYMCFLLYPTHLSIVTT